MNKIIIKDWFKKNIGGALLFPDGWFGRPYDNIHTLSDIEENDNYLQIKLGDGDTMLTFHGRCVAKADGKELSFSGFSLLVFSWMPYGMPKQNIACSKSYTNGEVVCVSRLGNTVSGV